MEKPISLSEAIQRQQGGDPPPADAGLFGAHIQPAECGLMVIPAPWDATASYGKGTAAGPAGVIQASHQMDLEDPDLGDVYRHGIGLDVEALHQVLKFQKQAENASLQQINDISDELQTYLEQRSRLWIDQGKVVGILGGEHSVPLGLIQALAECHQEFGILHIDAHFDLRESYEGYRQSHASIMHNVLESCPQVARLNQVAIRDFSGEERIRQQDLGGRGLVVYDRQIQDGLSLGRSFDEIIAPSIATLPQKVYVSFDIDGLDPALCPGTGTPVPGGLSFGQAQYLLLALLRSGREIIGFDLCEVAPEPDGSEWDANVGARLLYLLAGVALSRSDSLRG